MSSALKDRDLKAAVEFAKADRNSLRRYDFRELLKAYLTDLLDTHSELTAAIENNQLQSAAETTEGYTNYALLAANECKRLVGIDPELWESWIIIFIDYGQVHQNDNHEKMFQYIMHLL